MAGKCWLIRSPDGGVISMRSQTNFPFADEPRRSGRATKGQHTKDKDISEDMPAKKKGKGKGTKAKSVEEGDGGGGAEEEGDEIIRCICGTYEEEEDVPRAMICCDRCSAWQHNDCMGLPEDYAPDKYFCEQCRPDDHRDLLDAIARGDKPWEEAARRREAADKATKKKGGKKGRKSAGVRTSEVGSRASQEVEETATGNVAAGATGQKRKLEESPSTPELKAGRPPLMTHDGRKLTPRQTKKARGTPVADTNGARAASQSRKSSQMSPAPRQGSKSEPGQAIVQDVKELANASRKQAASTLIKLFIEQTKDAVKQGVYTVPTGSTVHDVATQIGLRVEHALYHIQSGGSGEPNEAYKNHLRSITFNVKKNHALATRLLQGDLTPHGLALMDPKDMATEEQKRKEAAIEKQLEKQHTIVEEQGPRIRRTHKGEEYVDESRQVAAESATSNAPVRKPSVVEQDGESKSPPATTPAESAATDARSGPVSKQSKPRPSVDVQRQSSANFDIDKVWSNVQGSPDVDGQRFGDLPSQSPGLPVREPAGPGTRADADIDELLKDEEAESPPYSPKDIPEGDGTVWRGVVNGGNLGRFHAAAKYAAGATPDSDTLRMTYNQLIPPEIVIGGRIQPARADEYLCGLEYSNTSDLVVVYMPEPQNSLDLDQFDKLFRYFKSKDRFGVGIQHQNPAIKDIYLIPLDAEQELPAFVKKLETNFPDPTRERMLLVPIVVKNSELPHNMNALAQDPTAVASPPMGQPAVQTPITPHEGNLYALPNNVPYAQAALSQQGINGTPQPAPNHNLLPSAPLYSTPNPPYPGIPAPSKASEAAQRILGHLATAPAVVQLIAQAPNVGELEMGVVKECINENAQAAQDLDVLTNMLQAKWSQPQG